MSGTRSTGFERLSRADTAAFRDARLVVHWLAQLPSAAGASLAEAAEDFSHTSLEWLPEGLLAGVALPDGRRAALDIGRLALVVLGADGAVSSELALRGVKLDDALAWLGQELNGELKMPTHELPAHPVAEGASVPEFAVDDLAELARWFGNAAQLLIGLADLHERSAPVRCWPHHFDIATLISLDAGAAAAGEGARSVGVGMTPGDGGVAVPYFYVTPWPYPPAEQLPPLEGGGRWNTEGWVGALLESTALEGNADEQGEQVARFLRSAVGASIGLLGPLG